METWISLANDFVDNKRKEFISYAAESLFTTFIKGQSTQILLLFIAIHSSAHYPNLNHLNWISTLTLTLVPGLNPQRKCVGTILRCNLEQIDAKL